MRAQESLGAHDPAEVGPYRLLGVLGQGGMGRVYLGRSRGGRLVAVKVVHRHLAADERFRARFASEVAVARLVSDKPAHDRTALVLAADPEAEVPWVATGYVAGSDLAYVVEEHGPLPERTVRALGVGLARALADLHAHGLVHRDVKPSNVLLALDGPHLIDFGIARAAEAATRLTSTGVAVGSPGFMAPEQVTGEADVSPATDVFSLGTVLAYAAGGEPPFPGDSAAQLLYRVAHADPRLDSVPPGPVREMISACLTKDPAARPGLPEIVRALAGEEGADALLDSPRWLPTAVGHEIGLLAVELLQLESDSTDPQPPVRTIVRPRSPTFVDPAPGPGPEAAATVTAAVQQKTGTEEKPKPKAEDRPKRKARDKPEPEHGRERSTARAKKTSPWLAVTFLALLAVGGYSFWMVHDEDKPAALPDAFIGSWSDAQWDDHTRLDLRAGRVGDEVGTLSAVLADSGSATCHYQLKLDRSDSVGWFVSIDAAPVAGGGAQCGTPLEVDLQQQSTKDENGNNIIAFNTTPATDSSSELLRVG